MVQVRDETVGRGGCRREHGEQAGELIVDAGIDKFEAAVAYAMVQVRHEAVRSGGRQREHGEQAGELVVDAGIDKFEAAVAYTDRLLAVEDAPRVEVSVDDGAARVDCDDAAVESVEDQAAQATEA